MTNFFGRLAETILEWHPVASSLNSQMSLFRDSVESDGEYQGLKKTITVS